MHEGKEYPCEACDHIPTKNGNLRRHNQTVHEGEKYPFDARDYLATREETLRTNKQSVHKGKKYSLFTMSGLYQQIYDY